MAYIQTILPNTQNAVVRLFVTINFELLRHFQDFKLSTKIENALTDPKFFVRTESLAKQISGPVSWHPYADVFTDARILSGKQLLVIGHGEAIPKRPQGLGTMATLAHLHAFPHDDTFSLSNLARRTGFPERRKPIHLGFVGEYNKKLLSGTEEVPWLLTPLPGLEKYSFPSSPGSADIVPNYLLGEDYIPRETEIIEFKTPTDVWIDWLQRNDLLGPTTRDLRDVLKSQGLTLKQRRNPKYYEEALMTDVVFIQRHEILLSDLLYTLRDLGLIYDRYLIHACRQLPEGTQAYTFDRIAAKIRRAQDPEFRAQLNFRIQAQQVLLRDIDARLRILPSHSSEYTLLLEQRVRIADELAKDEQQRMECDALLSGD